MSPRAVTSSYTVHNHSWRKNKQTYLVGHNVETAYVVCALQLLNRRHIAAVGMIQMEVDMSCAHGQSLPVVSCRLLSGSTEVA